jgi:hypothetical protein
MTRNVGAFVRKDKLEAKILIYEWGVLLLGAGTSAPFMTREQTPKTISNL